MFHHTVGWVVVLPDEGNVDGAVYSTIMSKVDEILALATRNPDGVSFRDFESLLSGVGFRFDRQSGSHMIYITPKGQRVSIQRRDGMAKGYQVRQVLKLIEE